MLETEFNECIEKIIARIKSKNDFLIIGHNDSDGITSTAIIFKALERENKKASALNLKQLYKSDIELIKEKGLDKQIIFVDLGSGQKTMLTEFENLIIIDHDQPQGLLKENFLELNPSYFEIDGAKDISSSGLTYLIAKKLNAKNFDLSSLAVTGALGDMQDFDSGALTGLNKTILNEAVENKIIKVEKELCLYGRNSRPLIQFLEFSSNPVIPLISANPENCSALLQKLGIELKVNEKWRTYLDLNQDEKKKLVSGLVCHLIDLGMEKKAEKLIGWTYSLLSEPIESPLYDLKQFSTLINSCSRHDLNEIALQVCLGDRNDNYFKMLSMWVQHRKALSEGLQKVLDKGIQENAFFSWFELDEIEETIVGIIAGMIYGSGKINPRKPIIALTESDSDKTCYKVSSRANYDLIKQGLNLGNIMKEISSEIQGEGGGHSVSAGIKFKKEVKGKFFGLLEQKIKEQMQME